MNIQALIPAAGMGRRMGEERPKALLELAGAPLLARTIGRIERCDFSGPTVVVVPSHFAGEIEHALAPHIDPQRISLVEGGAERQDSVAKGLDTIRADTEIIVIHDAARPFVDPEIVHATVMAAHVYDAATVAVPCIDTILDVNVAGFLETTPDRKRLWACQTPQTFRADPIRAAYRRAISDGRYFTDDATLFRAYGGSVKIVQGSATNLKITTREDLAYANYLIEGGFAPATLARPLEDA